MNAGKKTAAGKSVRRLTFLEKGFELFSSKSIEAVTLQDVADASGHGVATLYRYFSAKSGLLVEIAAWKWQAFFESNRKRRPRNGFEGKTAAEMYDFYLDSFVELYRHNRALLRFNQFLNIYIQSEEFEPQSAELYRGLMQPVVDYFHSMYEKARRDRTLRTDVPEEEMLSLTIHLMLAAATRYAVGLVYHPKGGFDAEKELETLKEMLIRQFGTGAQAKGKGPCGQPGSP